jgi:hypothetical protein
LGLGYFLALPLLRAAMNGRPTKSDERLTLHLLVSFYLNSRHAPQSLMTSELVGGASQVRAT